MVKHLKDYCSMDITQSSEFLRLHATMNKTKVLGPGDRFALWVQGCEKNCEGCMSQSSRDLTAGKQLSVESLVKTIVAEKDIEGITISGGEPFLQNKALYNLLHQLRESSLLGVIIYTGYYLSELKEKNEPEINDIINKYSDIIIDGPYDEALNDGKSLRGSSNQTVHFLTDRYKEFVSSIYEQTDRKYEIHYNSEEAFLVGIPDRKGYQAWRGIFTSKQIIDSTGG